MARKKVKDQGEDVQMDMSPMIDCVFLLLIFFIVVSTQSVVETDPKVAPTIASESAIQKDSIARIVVNAYYDEEAGGALTYTSEKRKPILEDELKKHISDEVDFIKRGNPSKAITLHLRCDRFLEWKEIQKVKKAAALSGVINVNFASYQEDE